MSGAGSGSVPKRPKNPLLYGADLGFPFDNLQGSAILMPIAHEETSEPIADASKPSASVLPPEPSPAPASNIPSAAAPLFSLFKQALGSLSEPQIPMPQPAPQPATSEVPLYAPTAAPILVPLFDPKTLEVNGNEPTEDGINGNPAAPPQSVSFFDPSRFQSAIASLRGASSPAQFTQQPPPDLPAPTPKSDTTLNNQGQSGPIFSVAPSNRPPSMPYSATVPAASTMELPAQSRDVAEVPSAPPTAEPGYGFNSQYLSNSQFQDQAVPSYEQNQNAGTNYNYEQQYGGGYYDQYQAPQFYDPSSYQNSNANQMYPQPNQYFDQSAAPQESHAHPQMYDPSQYQPGVVQSEISSLPQSQPPVPAQEATSAQDTQVPPPVTFFNPAKYQVETQQPPAVPQNNENYKLPTPPPKAEDQQSYKSDVQDNFVPQPVTFFNPGQYPEESPQLPPPAGPQNTETLDLPPLKNEQQQSSQSGIQENFQQQPVAFFNPGQYQFSPPTEPLLMHSPPLDPQVQQTDQRELQDDFAPNPVTFFNPGQYQVDSQHFPPPAVPQNETPKLPTPRPKAEDQQSYEGDVQDNFAPQPVTFFNPGQYPVESQQFPPPAGPPKVESPKLPTPPPQAQDQHDNSQDNFSPPQPVSFFNPNQYPVANQQQFLPPLPNEAEDARFPTPPALAQDQQSNQSEDLQLNSSLSQISLQEQRGSPIQSEASIPEPEPLNVYNINQNTSIYQHSPSEFLNTSATLPAEPPVSSTPLSSYFTQKFDSRPSSVASNRSQLTSFFDRQDTPTQGGLKSAADFFDSPQSFVAQPSQPSTLSAAPPSQGVNLFNAPVQNQNAPQVFSAFSQSQPQSAANFFNPSQQTKVEPQPPVAPVAHFFAPPAPTATPPVQVAPPAASAPKALDQNVAPASKFFTPGANTVQDNQPPAPQFFAPAPQQSAQPPPVANFFTPAPSGGTSDIFAAPPVAASFFEPQQILPVAPKPAATVAAEFLPPPAAAIVPPPAAAIVPPPAAAILPPPAAKPVEQHLPPAAFHSPVRSATLSPVDLAAPATEPSVQLFNPTLFSQAPKADGPPVGDANKLRRKTALNKYAVPPSLANTAPSYIAPAAVFPPVPPTVAQPANYLSTQPLVVNPHSTPAASSFFTPGPSHDAAQSKTPPNTPAVQWGTANPMAQFFNPAQGTSMHQASEESMHQALTSPPAFFVPNEPLSSPVAPFTAPPAVIDSNSAALKQHFGIQQQQKQVSFFNPAKSQDAPVNPVEVNSANQPPPPQSAMSGGNNYRLNSRPQYAPMPGLGSSVSAMASLAASMAMSSPLPGAAAEPRDGFAPVSAISISNSSADPSLAHSLPTDIPSDYKPVTHHWFHKRQVEKQISWHPFSTIDNDALEKVYQSGNKDTLVATDGGRYDVNVHERKRMPIFWDQPPNDVRRCSWFYKNPQENLSFPYEELFSTKLEEEYRTAFLNSRWPRRVELSFGEAIVFTGPITMTHIPPTSGSILEDWGTIQDIGAKSRVVLRGCDHFEIDEGESGKPDHLLFLVHGIGSVCDLRFRTVIEVVDDFRNTTLGLIRSHFKQAGDDGRASRIEVLPVSWHGALHGEETGIDKQLQNITLKSIPRLRHFTNDTLLDILFYTSPVYCQTIIQTVGHEINRMHTLFMQRNPDYTGGVSLGGHSLGSLILFDLLCHQKPQNMPEPDVMFGGEEVELDEQGKVMPPATLIRRDSCKVEYMTGHQGTGQPSIHYPQLHFNPMSFFALGSPVGMFVTVRGIECLGVEFTLPTCPAMFNIFHPFDPVAYRIESLVNPELGKLRPILIPHHKGRKRMHLELRDTMTRVSADIKEKLVDSVKSTWNTVYQLAMFNRGENLEQEVDKVLAEQMAATDALIEEQYPEGMEIPEPDEALLGKLNRGRRVDYVLQEAPIESVNEYFFALSSHVCYWESLDTILMMVKEIYNSLGTTPDRQFDRTRENSAVRELPRERSWSGGSRSSKGSPSPSTAPNFLSPTNFPGASHQMAGPPPTSGFVRK